MDQSSLAILAQGGKPGIVPPLDPGYRPASLANRAFRAAVRASGRGVPLVLALERGDGQVSVYKTEVFAPDAPEAGLNLPYAERLVKFLLWQKGGWRLVIDGPAPLAAAIRAAYSPGGARDFDREFMSGVYERPFVVEEAEPGKIPAANESGTALGGHLEGCRIGFDLGASDRKVAALIDGRTVFAEEVVWHPKNHEDPAYHYHQIQSALHHAASFLPRVDAIGGSSAGVYINNRVMVASLFRAVPPERFTAGVKDLFLRISREWGVPLEVINDGEVTALAGAMTLGDRAVLGVAMGSSEAAGYVTPEGKITTWLNELAFAPVDYRPEAPVDEWSGDHGCGVQYFSQEAVIRLAGQAGVALDGASTPAEKLKQVQQLLAEGDGRVRPIFETIGCYLGYAVAHYADYYDLRHLLILGRVTSGEGGRIILAEASRVLAEEFPDLAAGIKLHLPEEEAERRVGQAIAAASLPVLP
ncbi:MAG: ROK family protein [Patescibacteria group bacterium]